MKRRFRYDEVLDPPGPMLALRVAVPRSELAMVVRALVDTGADCTLIPERVARGLRLPVVGTIEITGVGGATRRAPVHAASVEFASARRLARVAAFEDEAILGRDLLNAFVTRLDGPALAFWIAGRSRTRR